MAVQTTYELNSGIAYAGGLYDTSSYNSVSRSVESGTVRYGQGVAFGADPDTQVATSVDRSVFLGIAIRENVREAERAPLVAPNGTGETYYLSANETVSVMTQGRIWVTVNDDVTAGGGVFINQGADGTVPARVLGDFASAITNSEHVQIVGARFLTSAVAGELAVVELT